ncbi:MAG: SdrD B-like domain-containing protein [Phaeodactylibacter sp.]|uniref:SdrD B-like domain-containing protein n=1 Tax=Phaeodactylibacter sp. TaxID=1940289 RepID=UPI0032EB14A2
MKKRYALSVSIEPIHFTKLTLQALFLSLSLLGVLSTGMAQVAVTYPAQAEDVVACNAPGALRVRLRFTSNSADVPVVTINLPPGLQYEAGSLSALGGNLSIEESDLSDPGAPQFSVTPADVSANDIVDFSIIRSGGCEARAFAVNGGLFKDTVMVQTAAGIVIENNPNLNTYNLLFASLSHQYPNGPNSQDTIISDVPQTINRPVRLTQGGLGFVDALTYYVVLGDVQDYALWFGGSPLVPSASSGDTLFYELSASLQPGIFGGDARFSNGEQIDFEERFEVQTCTQGLNRVAHHAYWGCGADICQRSIPATGSVAVIVPQPSIVTGKLFDRNLPACLDGSTPDQFGFFIENTGATTAQFGFQLGFEGSTSIPVFGDYAANSASIDTASIQLTLNGADISRSPDEVFGAVNFCLAGLPKGEVSAARYFNFTLHPGDRLEIRGDYVYCCRESCNTNLSWPTPIARFQVRDACGNIPRMELASHDFANARLGTTPTIISGPATIFDGQTATYCFQYPSLDGYPNVSGDNTYAVELSMPADFDLQLTGDAQVLDVSGAPLPFELIGLGTGRPSLIIQQSDYTGGAVEFCLDLAWSCGGAGLVEMPVVLYQTVGTGCEAACYLGISCSSFPVLLFCPGGGCDGGGGTVTYSATERINVGFSDPGNERVWQNNAPADRALARLDRAAPCDTMRTTAGLGVLSGPNGPWAQGRFRQAMLFPYFKSLGAKVRVFNNGALIGEVDDVPVANVQGDTLFDYNLSAAYLHELDPTFPETFVYAPGDSVFIETYYYFDPVLAQGDFYDYAVEGFSPVTAYCVDNQDIRNAFDLSNNDFQTRDGCGVTIDRVQLVSAAVSFASGGTGSFTGCEELTWEVFTRTQRGCVINDDIDFFPNEFRPVFAFDTFALAKIPGYTFRRLQYRRSPAVFTIDVEPFAEDADSLYFDIRNLYSDRGGPIPLWEEQARDEILKSFWQPSCASEQGAVYGSARVQYEDPSCGALFSLDRTRLLSYTPIGQFSYVLNPLVNNAFTEENCYTLSVANTGVGSGFNVPYTWLEVISEDGLVAVESIRETGGSSISLDGAGIYQLGQHASNTTEQIEICVSQTSCQPDSILVVYGWNCEGYPSLENPVESCFLDTLVAYINPQLAEVQLQITDQPSPSEPLELCGTDTIEVLVNSAQQADLLNPVLDVILPPGVEVNSMSAGYPNDGSIVFESLPGIINGDTVTFDLTAHSRVVGDSLPGTFTNPNFANRQMRLVFEIETGCGFDPLKTVAFYRARGFSPCSDPAIGSEILVASNPINVVGADAPYSTSPEVTANGALEGCGSTVRVSAAFSLMDGETTGRDTSVLVVPPGIGYVPGSLICESPDAGSCPVFAGIQLNADGQAEIRFALPEALLAGTEIAFSFEVEEAGAACATPAVALFRNLITRDPLTCNGLPCLTELEVATGQDTVALTIQKPVYTFTGTSLCVGADSTFQLEGSLLVSGTGQAADEEVTLQVYCTGANGQPSGMPISSVVLDGLAPIGSLLPIDLDGELCAGATGLWLEATPSCGCDTAVLFLPLSAPTAVACPADFSVCLDASPIPLTGATPAGGVYEGAGVTGATFDPALAGAGIHPIVYTYTDGLGCQSSCTFDIEVAALPEVTCPPSSTVCIDVPAFALSGALPEGGTYTGPGVANGIFDPVLSDSGLHSLTYTLSDSSGCSAACTFTIAVDTLPELDCPDLPAVCVDGTPFVLTGSLPVGGTYTGPGVENGVFDPSEAGMGVHVLTYTYTNSSGCTSSCSIEISVNGLPAVTCPPDQEVSLSDDAFELSGGAPAGGIYSGPGLSNGVFDPLAAGTGAHVVTYTFTDVAGCTASCSFTLTVSAAFAELGDFVWLDANQNGLQDAGESGLPGVQVILERAEGNTFLPVDTTVTDGAGYYHFIVAPGAYRVRFIPTNGLEVTMPLQGQDPQLDSDVLPDGRVTGVYVIEEGMADLSIDAGFFSICDNVTDPGQIGPDQYLCGPGNTPEPMVSLSGPEGGSGALEYLWMRSILAGPFNLQTWAQIPNSNSPVYAPGPLSETTYFARCIRRENCTVYLESNIVTIEVGNESVAEMTAPEVLCVGEPATFTAADAGPGALYEWTMGLGLAPSSATGPEVTLSAPYSHGRFNVTLSVTTNGCTATQTRRITATQSPFYCGAPLPLSANELDIQGVSCVKVDWMLEELQPGYTYTVLHLAPGDDTFRPIAWYDAPTGYLGAQCYYKHLHDDPGPGVHRYQLEIQTPDGGLLYSEVALVALLDEVVLFPNPATHQVTVSLAEPFGRGDVLELFNAQGQILQRQYIQTNDTQLDLDLSGLPAGPYFVRLRDGQTKWELLRFVKE